MAKQNLDEPVSFVKTHDRIIAAISDGEDGYIHMHFVDFFPEEPPMPGAREGYCWKIFDEDMVLIGEATSKRDYILSGVGIHLDPQEMLTSFLSFLQAAAEEWRSMGSNSDSKLFDSNICEWAYQNDTALLMLLMEINPNGF